MCFKGIASISCAPHTDKFLDKYGKVIGFQVSILKALDSMMIDSLSFLKNL